MVAGLVIVLLFVPVWAREVAACGVVSCCVASWATQENEGDEKKELPVAAVKKTKMSKKGAVGRAARIELLWSSVMESLQKSGAAGHAAEIRSLWQMEKTAWGQERRKSCEHFVKEKEKWNAEAKILKCRIQGLQEALEFMIERYGMPNESDGKNLK